MHLLFLCTGNTCRSPMAEFIAKWQIAQRGHDWQVSSGGLHAMPGMPMAANARAALNRRQIDVEDHASTPVTTSLIHAADIIFTMTYGHKAEFIRQFPGAADKVHELGVYIRDVATPSIGQYDIVDPFGGSDEVYEACAGILADGIELLLDKLERQCDSGDVERNLVDKQEGDGA